MRHGLLRAASPRLVSALAVLALPKVALAQMVMTPQAAPTHFAFGAPAPTATGRTVSVVVRGLRFDPARLAARPGETIRFVVRNPTDLAHEFVLGDAASEAAHRAEMRAMPGGGMDNDPNAITIKAHSSATLSWTFGSPGVVKYDCDLPGHYEAGMRGVVSVR